MRALYELPPEQVEGRGVDPAASGSLLIMAVGTIVFWSGVVLLVLR
ncbi:hypothetical protein ACNFJ7_06635 [Sphingomonas sp. HT-1]|nr:MULTISPECIES: hypothetical protein [unclassified Sphingomonas]